MRALGSIAVGHEGDVYPTDIVPNPCAQYLCEFDISAGDGTAPNLSQETELQWYLDNFPDGPSVFLVDTIDGTGLINPAGINYEDFIWVSDNWVPWVADEDVTLAHEIGHLLGLDHSGIGSIMDTTHFDPDPTSYPLYPFQIEDIRDSMHLTPIPDSTPTPH